MLMSFDVLEIKQFYVAGFEHTDSNTALLNTFPKKGLTRLKQTFNEFFINDKALILQLTDFFKETEPISVYWVGALGFHLPPLMEELKVKELQKKDFDEELIINTFSKSVTKRDLKKIIKNNKIEFSDEKTLLYVCPQCGDYACGGISASILIENDFVEWAITNDDEDSKTFGQVLNFRFEKKAYMNTLDAYVRSIKIV